MQWMKRVLAKLPVIFLKEKQEFVAYTPALDLSTAGKTIDEARIHFKEAAQLFLETCQTMGTLDEILEELGWEKQSGDWVPPLVVEQGSETVSISLPT